MGKIFTTFVFTDLWLTLSSFTRKMIEIGQRDGPHLLLAESISGQSWNILSLIFPSYLYVEGATLACPAVDFVIDCGFSIIPPPFYLDMEMWLFLVPLLYSVMEDMGTRRLNKQDKMVWNCCDTSRHYLSDLALEKGTNFFSNRIEGSQIFKSQRTYFIRIKMAFWFRLELEYWSKTSFADESINRQELKILPRLDDASPVLQQLWYHFLHIVFFDERSMTFDMSNTRLTRELRLSDSPILLF